MIEVNSAPLKAVSEYLREEGGFVVEFTNGRMCFYRVDKDVYSSLMESSQKGNYFKANLGRHGDWRDLTGREYKYWNHKAGRYA